DIAFLLPLTIKTIIADNDGSPLLPNTGVIQIEGNPTDGWTLVSWNGTPIPPDPGLLTELLMDLRALIEAPQTAIWGVHEALQGGDLAAVVSALEAGVQSVGAALLQFPVSVINDIVGAVTNLGSDTGGADDAVAALF
ncbi:MAG TPA: histidine phosphatase family protein, partial [Mycobacterium sp.]|nr:histidine phosphatase family protein [Mycobacterium sp.]